MSNPYLVCNDRELRALPTQWLLARQWVKANNLLSDLNFVEAKTARLGIDELFRDYTTALQILPKDANWHELLKSKIKVLHQQAHGLRSWNPQEQPTYFLQQMRQIRNEIYAQDLEQWQELAAKELASLEKPYLFERFPFPSHSSELRTLVGHSRAVTSVALSADGQLAISGSYDQTIRIWDVSTGREIRQFAGINGAVNCVALSANGRVAVSASNEQTVKVWDVSTGHELRSLNGNAASIQSLALSADGKLAIAVSGHENTLIAWNVETGHELYTLQAESYINYATAVTLSADGRLAIVGRANHKLTVLNATTGKEICTFTKHNGSMPINSVGLSADGRLAISVAYATPKVWDVATGQDVCDLEGSHTNGVSAVALSADGRLAISASHDGTLTLWDVGTAREIGTFVGHSASVNDIALSADGQFFISSSEDRSLKIWDTSILSALSHPPKTISELITNKLGKSHLGVNSKALYADTTRKVEPKSVDGVALSADGQIAVSVSSSPDYVFKAWDTNVGREVYTTPPGRNVFTGRVVLTADGRLAICAEGQNNTLLICDVFNGLRLGYLWNESAEHTAGLNSRNCVALSANGRLAISASYEDLRVWDVVKCKELHTMKGHTANITALALSADGRLAISGSIDRTLKVWDVISGREHKTLYGYSGDDDGLALSANGQLAISKLDDHILKVWKVKTGEELRTLGGNNGYIYDVALSADGRIAAIASDDMTVGVWDVTTGRCIASLLIGIPMKCCAMAANGRVIVVGDVLGHVHFLDLMCVDRIQSPKTVKFEKSWYAQDEEKLRSYPSKLLNWLKRLLAQKE